MVWFRSLFSPPLPSIGLDRILGRNGSRGRDFVLALLIDHVLDFVSKFAAAGMLASAGAYPHRLELGRFHIKLA